MCDCHGRDWHLINKPDCGPLCNFGVWEPRYPRQKPVDKFVDNHEFTAFNCYALSFELAAKALAEHPEAQYDEAMQYDICHEHGVFLDQCTEDELAHLFNLANEFMGV